MGTGRLKNLAFINGAVGFVNPATEVVEPDSRPKRLAIGGVAKVKEKIPFLPLCLGKAAVGLESYRPKC